MFLLLLFFFIHDDVGGERNWTSYQKFHMQGTDLWNATFGMLEPFMNLGTLLLE